MKAPVRPPGLHCAVVFAVLCQVSCNPLPHGVPDTPSPEEMCGTLRATTSCVEPGGGCVEIFCTAWDCSDDLEASYYADFHPSAVATLEDLEEYEDEHCSGDRHYLITDICESGERATSYCEFETRI